VAFPSSPKILASIRKYLVPILYSRKSRKRLELCWLFMNRKNSRYRSFDLRLFLLVLASTLNSSIL
jgi:hypothetical protein